MTQTKVFLRTHHSDNHPHASGVYNFVRDILKSSMHKNTFTASKATLTRLLNIALDMPESDYRTFAITMASGLSCYGSNTSFELRSSNDINAILRECQSPEVVRSELCILMHIIFTKIQKYNFMVEEGGSNTYRLIYCRLQTSKEKSPYAYAIFSFVFQCVLTGYVMLQIYENCNKCVDRDGNEIEDCEIEYFGCVDKDRNEIEDCVLPYGTTISYQMLVLAVLTTIYSAILACPVINEIPDAWNIFGSYGIMQMMDFIVNGILPITLLVSGFFVIWGQGSYIEAVLNTAALLFIPQIDDDLPQLLGFKPNHIVKNFLIKETIDEFNKLHHKDYATRKKLKVKYYNEAKKVGSGVQFADHIITNVVEQGSDPSEGFLFQPFQVRKGEEEGDHQIDPCCFVTESCLIRKIAWRFTVFKPNPNTSKPRIGYLRIETLLGETIEFKRTEEASVMLGKEYSLHGVYLITNFQISQDILRLRVCGSRTARDFQTAFEYYTLWPITKNAKMLLERQVDIHPKRFSVTTRNQLGFSDTSGMCEKV